MRDGRPPGSEGPEAPGLLATVWPGVGVALVSMNETKFIELYTEITECSENRARSVYMVISEGTVGRGVLGAGRDGLAAWPAVVSPGLGRLDGTDSERKP